jgi:hypothetical protein
VNDSQVSLIFFAGQELVEKLAGIHHSGVAAFVQLFEDVTGPVKVHRISGATLVLTSC